MSLAGNDQIGSAVVRFSSHMPTSRRLIWQFIFNFSKLYFCWCIEMAGINK